VSLRGRLVATLLVLAAAALVVLGAVTYATQRSYLDQRLDDQTRFALGPVGRALDGQGSRLEGAPRAGPDPDRHDHDGGPGPAEVSLPPGTYGERRDAEGDRIGSPVVLSQALAPPELTRGLRPGDVLTVGAQGDGDLHYRVRVAPSPGGQGVTIVALPRSGVEQTLDRLLLVEALVIAGVLAVLAAVSWKLVGVGLRPLEQMAGTAGAIAGGDLSRRVETATPKTEVGRLGLALNAMLTRLEGAFREREASEERLRRFLADASHELRTPLASIRGYAELFRIGAAREPAEVETAMRRIEDEAARMGVLVEDLLILARLDEVRDSAAEIVDLAALADDAAADARAVAPDREIAAHAAGGDDDALVLGDADRLRQVLANLMRNALVHTPGGTPVDVWTGRRDGRVVVEVRDHGPGLPPGDPAALFGRFWRAEGGRERGRGGAGLGLAIVAAIVAAHHGEVDARNAEGGGAAFTVALPPAPREPAED
jgi:two-component system OmpR family sensor kinase